MIKTPDDVVFQRRTQEELLEWGADDFKLIEPRLKQKRVCLDIGAHIGLTTLRFAKHFQHVHSFEPLMHEYLQENTNHLKNVTLYFNAVTDEEKELEMFSNPHNSGSNLVNYPDMQQLINSRWLRENARFDATPVKVKGISIDSLNLKDVDLVKIDVEGYNMPVLNGMINTLKYNSPVVQIENHPENPDVGKNTHIFLQKLGYVRYHITSNKPQDWFYYKG